MPKRPVIIAVTSETLVLIPYINDHFGIIILEKPKKKKLRSVRVATKYLKY